LHTKIVEGENKQSYVETLTGRAPIVVGSSKANGPVSLVCAVTGAHAKYRDPLSGQPLANKEAFKIIREKYF